MKKYLCLALLLFVTGLYAQKNYKFPSSFSASYDFKPEDAFQKLSKDPKFEKDKTQLESFGVNYIFNEQYTFDYNRVYLNWDEVEIYLLKILEKTLPKNIRTKHLDLFLQRSPVANAGTSTFGNVFLNVGLICEAENEAFLAAVMAHEAGHYILNHGTRRIEEYGVDTYRSNYSEQYKEFFRKARKMEAQADSFAIACLKNANINLVPLLQYHEGNDATDMALIYSRSYKNMMIASSLSPDALKKRRNQVYNPYASHPSALERYSYVVENLKENPTGDNFFVDSLFFLKLKKLAKEEQKKIAMEECNFNSCANYALVDFMYEPKNFKNLYYLIESTRRILYSKPDLADRGFLTENLDNNELYYNNKSVLHKPYYLFNTYRDYKNLETHPLLTSQSKPFETYSQAFMYFTNEAIKLGFNEAYFSRALYYTTISKQDSARKYLEEYIKNGNGIHLEYASVLLNKQQPFPDKKRTLMIYNNIGNYTGFNFNYYLASKRKVYNTEVKQKFANDSSRLKLVIVNELLGKSPFQLYETKKLMQNVFSLYSEEDIDACKKIRLTSHYAGENDRVSKANKKQLLLYAPEWFLWFKENGYSNLFLVDVIYQYNSYMKMEESFNNYTGYYLDLNQDRPVFRDADRSGFKYMQKEKEIHASLYSFLYE